MKTMKRIASVFLAVLLLVSLTVPAMAVEIPMTNKLTSLAVTTMPNKTVYKPGETFSIAGMVVTATYAFGDSYVLEAYSYPKTALVNGQTSVTISYSEQGITKSTTCPITVANKILTGISVTTPPTKTIYAVGETFSPVGMVVTATYDDGSTAEVVGSYSIAAFAKGETSKTISYNGKTCTTPVTVSMPVVPKTLAGIAVTKAPTKTNYTKGETFDLTGMVVTATYSDSSTAVITGYYCSTAPFTGGETSVAITCEDMSCTTPVTVTAGLNNITDYYSYVLNNTTGEYKLKLNPEFKTALNTKSDYKDWKVGNPLPNPGNSYNGKPITNMSMLFMGMFNVTSLDLSAWDTSNVKTMSGMFYGCLKLTSVKLNGFDTSKVTDMSYMFHNCYKLKALDLSSFNTAKVTNTTYMFFNCTSLTALELSNFNTALVNDSSFMPLIVVLIQSIPSVTCLFVRIIPVGSMTTPDAL